MDVFVSAVSHTIAST